MKVGLYTIHSHYNYGAMLQASATQAFIRSLGHDVEVVNVYSELSEKENEVKTFTFNPKSILSFLYAKFHPKIQEKFRSFRNFHSKLNLSRRYFSYTEIFNNPPLYDLHVVGSDQVWNLERGYSEENRFYFLDFLPAEANKLSYASSFGSSAVDNKYADILKNNLSSFERISVREFDGVKIIKEQTNFDATQVLDPTFLLSPTDWEKLIESNPLIMRDYIFCYGFDGSRESRDMIESTRKKLQMPVICVSVSIFFPLSVDIFKHDVGPLEFLNLIKNSKFVITSSYHGVAFAIQFQKDFFATKHPTRNSRLETLLGLVGLEHRQLSDPKSIADMTDANLRIEYSPVIDRLKMARDLSIKWLKQAIYDIELNSKMP